LNGKKNYLTTAFDTKFGKIFIQWAYSHEPALKQIQPHERGKKTKQFTDKNRDRLPLPKSAATKQTAPRWCERSVLRSCFWSLAVSYFTALKATW